MNWSFAIINNRLAEIYFNKTKRGVRFLGHCYVKKSEFKTKAEQRWIEEDTAKVRLMFRNDRYKRVLSKRDLG